MSLSIRQATAIAAGVLMMTLSMPAQDKVEKLELKQAEADLYLKVNAGAAYLQDLHVNVGSQEEFKFNTGARLDLGLGYNFSECWAAELECGVIWNAVDEYGGDSFGARGARADFYQIPIMVNYVYRLTSKGPLDLFVGGGVGMVVGIFNFKDDQFDFDDGNATFGYQAMAGLNYHLSQRVDLNAAYKFLGTTGHEWSEGAWMTETASTFTHAVVLGVSVKY